MFFNKFCKKAVRLICAVLALLLACLPIAGCKSRELKPSNQALLCVGSVGSYDVPYEEFFYLASLYDSKERSEEEIRTLIGDNIVTNYAILTLCDRLGVSIDQKELDDAVQSELDGIIEEEFGGKRKNYISSLEELGMTDHYVRFTLRTDFLYSQAQAALDASGEMYTEEAKIIEYIKENFVRTWHVMIADNKGESSADNLAEAQEVLKDLRDGKTDIYQLTKNGTNEDILMPFDGYAFARGTKDKAYEEAAFSLRVGEYSDVVTFKSELASGEYVDAHYIIERLSIDDEYIDEHYDTLADAYRSAFVALKLEQVKQELEFIPNDYALSLDIKNLPDIDAGTDVGLIIIISVCVLLALIAAAVVIIVIRHCKKRRMSLKAVKEARAQIK